MSNKHVAKQSLKDPLIERVKKIESKLADIDSKLNDITNLVGNLYGGLMDSDAENGIRNILIISYLVTFKNVLKDVILRLNPDIEDDFVAIELRESAKKFFIESFSSAVSWLWFTLQKRGFFPQEDKPSDEDIVRLSYIVADYFSPNIFMMLFDLTMDELNTLMKEVIEDTDKKLQAVVYDKVEDLKEIAKIWTESEAETEGENEEEG